MPVKIPMSASTLQSVISRSCAGCPRRVGTVMKRIRNQVIVALASSAVLASGLSVAAVAASSAASGAVPVAASATSDVTAVPFITVYDP